MTVARIQTHSGRMVDPLHLSVQDIRLEDIAHALSHLCRFTGHVKRFYSVAEHSVYASYLVPEEYAADALLHDASEAYLQDIPSPLKSLPEFAFYREAEQRAMGVIHAAFGVLPYYRAGAADVYKYDWIVRSADLDLLHYEARHLMDAEWANPHRVAAVDPYGCIDPIDLGWLPVTAKDEFLYRAAELGIG